MLKTLMPPRKKKIRVGPEDDGRSMSLAEFDKAIGQEGYTYELNHGVIEVTNNPHRHHFAQTNAVRDQLIAYKESKPGIIKEIGAGSASKVLIESQPSERHPDLAVYLSPMPDADEIWSIWIPTILVEVVSERSARRDYKEKTEEYLEFGIQEYWIVDSFKNQMTVLTRFRGAWKQKVLKPSQKYSTRHLPGFILDLKRVISAGK